MREGRFIVHRSDSAEGNTGSLHSLQQVLLTFFSLLTLIFFILETESRVQFTLSVRQRGRQHGAGYGNARWQGGAAGDVANRNGFAVDCKGGAGAQGRRVVRALRRRRHDARESGSDEAWNRSGVVVLRQATASRDGARRAGPAERADGLARAANVGREAVLGAAVGRGGRARDAVGDDKLEPGDHGVFVENDLKAKRSKREMRRRRS